MAKRTRLRFEFLGWQDGWYVLRLLTRGHAPLDVREYENEILEWLIEQDITPNEQSYLANGNTGDGPVVPAMADGSALCLLLRLPADVLRFEQQFGCRGITPETMFAALRAEASVHRFVLADLALIAYDAIRRYALVYGEDFPQWTALIRDEQQFFLQLTREYLENPDRSPAQMHDAWKDRRQIEGWSYASEVDLDQHRHPSMVPFNKLPGREQAKTRLIVSVVIALAPLL